MDVPLERRRHDRTFGFEGSRTTSRTSTGQSGRPGPHPPPSADIRGRFRARQHRDSIACDTVLHDQHDALFNLIGRRTHDLVWNKMFLRGVQDVTERTDRYKPDAMRGLAARIETLRYKKIAPEVASAAAEAIREAADALDSANQALVPLVSAHKELLVQFYANARLLQVQLSRLSKRWAAEVTRRRSTTSSRTGASPGRQRTRRKRSRRTGGQRGYGPGGTAGRGCERRARAGACRELR